MSLYLQIPGVNIPFRHLVYYFITLTVAGTLHEMGHAIAAARYTSSKIILCFVVMYCIYIIFLLTALMQAFQ